MSKKALAILLVIAAALAALALWPAAKSHKTVPGPLFQHARLTESTQIDFKWIDSDGANTEASIMRGPGSAEWLITRGGASWPAEDARVNGFLRLLADASATPLPDGPAEQVPDTFEGTAATRITFSGPSGELAMLELSGVVLAGNVQAMVKESDAQSRTVTMPADVAGVVAKAGVTTWATPLAFPAGPGTPSRITLRGAPGRELALQRKGSTWFISGAADARGIGVPADANAVSGLLATLNALGAGDVRQATSGGATGGAALVISIAADRRVPDGESVRRSEVVQTLILRAGPESNTPRAVARIECIETPAEREARPVQWWGPIDADVDGVTLTSLSLERAPYASRIASSAAPADVRRLELAAGPVRVVAARTATGWQPQTPTNASSASPSLSPTIAAAVLRLVAETPAATVRASPPGPASPSVTLSLMPAEGPPLDTLTLRIENSTVVASCAGLEWVYGDATAAIVAPLLRSLQSGS